MVAFYLPGNIAVHVFSLLFGSVSATPPGRIAFHASIYFRSHYVNAGIINLLAALITSMAFSVFVNWEYFEKNTFEMVWLESGE